MNNDTYLDTAIYQALLEQKRTVETKLADVAKIIAQLIADGEFEQARRAHEQNMFLVERHARIAQQLETMHK